MVTASCESCWASITSSDSMGSRFGDHNKHMIDLIFPYGWQHCCCNRNIARYTGHWMISDVLHMAIFIKNDMPCPMFLCTLQALKHCRFHWTAVDTLDFVLWDLKQLLDLLYLLPYQPAVNLLCFLLLCTSSTRLS